MKADFEKLVQEFYEAVAAMTKKEFEEIKELNRSIRESSQLHLLMQQKRHELLHTFTAIKKLKRVHEKRLLQEQIEKLNSL